MKKRSGALLAGMGFNVGLAAVIAVGATAVGVGALDHVPSLYGSDSMALLAFSVWNRCTALQTLGQPITYYGGGSASGEAALEQLGVSSTQMIAPMARQMGSGICSVPASSRAGAEGMVIALDAVSIVVNSSTVGAEGIDYSGTAGNTSNQWRTVLRQVYTGMPDSAGSNIFAALRRKWGKGFFKDSGVMA